MHGNSPNTNLFHTYHKASWWNIGWLLLCICSVNYILFTYIYYQYIGELLINKESNFARYIQHKYFLLFFGIELVPFACIFLPIRIINKFARLLKWAYLILLIWSMFYLPMTLIIGFLLSNTLAHNLGKFSDTKSPKPSHK